MKHFEMKIHPGFTVYRNGFGPVWVCQHTGPALINPASRDDNSDVVANLCWLRTGGTLIFSTLSRKRQFGIDFNRDAPPEDLATLLWNDFAKREKMTERMKNYEKSYAWVAKDHADHQNRSNIYENFWRTVRNSGNIIIFFHRSFTSLANFPSIMEMITYKGQGVKLEVISAIVEAINKKYEGFFKEINNHYKHTILLEELRFIDSVKAYCREFDRKVMGGYDKDRISDSLKVMEKYAGKRVLEQLKKGFNGKNFVAAVESVLKNKIPPQITVENRFTGDKALTKKKPIFSGKNIVMEIESSSFINYWHPSTARDIVIDLLNSIVSVDMYKKMGIKQTQIIKFIKSDIDRTEAVKKE
jgi:hypothetical protein